MYEIKIAKSAGFCFGVDRAIKLVYKEIEKNKKVVTLGPIIHNKDVV
ncbi:MAG: alpha/beta hydrolase, partial [Crenarchaeota archaeon]|nr:alpha/beta hydrolase [Thermoproteota archaeon]